LPQVKVTYRGRLAPSPTGFLHLGHACTFWTAYRRAVEHAGTLVLRDEDLDPQRSRREFSQAAIEDLRWLGISWQEGPDVGGPYAPYSQSLRHDFYLRAWRQLRDAGAIYPCSCSRKDLLLAAQAPHESTGVPGVPAVGAADDEPLYPGTCRDRSWANSGKDKSGVSWEHAASPAGINWRFRVPDGRTIGFDDLRQGRQEFVAGRDFGDFLVWRRDDVPAYQLAVVVDDAAMRITEVVRGMDLLRSTARQILLARALGIMPPDYYHCPLVLDETGARLAKRNDALSLRALRAAGTSAEELQKRFQSGFRLKIED
jgi:glutamyl-tRNA synthetase